MIYTDGHFAYAAFYVMNIYKAATDAATGNLNHTWSLAIEEQFYIFWSIVLFMAFRESRSRRMIAGGTLAFIAVLILWRAVRAGLGTDSAVLYYSTECRIDALLIGCVASMIYCWRLLPDEAFRSRAFSRITCSGILVAALIYLSFRYTDTALYFGFISLFNVCVGFMILWIVTRDGTAVHKVLSTALMRWIGRISYSLYLWHFVFFEFSKKSFETEAAQVAAGIAFSVAAGAASYYLVEKPFLQLKARFESRAVVPS